MWDQLAISKAHWAYLILGGFTSLFMLCSLFVKEKLYIGEATVATLCGVIFGPHAANLFDPSSWGNVDLITLECSRIVLVVQCFAIGVELPKAYMERHWRSVTFLLVPVMAYGWLITSLFIWWMVEPLTWLESLMCAACVTATDPVLASSVVGKGKFAKRVPKHLRDVLSAESGCNDGMAFPFIYLSYYLIHYHLDANKVAQHWFCNTILYECVWGAVYGFLIGYIGRHAIKWADRRNLIDRESFLVFYFVLALFCAGTGSTLGTDDLLVGFSAGVGFSNDGWFTQKTEESHVSNVIDLLLNLAYFVYLGAVIPWEQYNAPMLGLTPWRLVVISVLVILFRRIPIMLALKPIIPDVKTWREALFAGHFGPIGVGAIYAALLARAELETDTTQPLAVVPTDPHAQNYAVIQIIWPVTTFLVISSILVHGSSIAVFTLGKRINQFSLTMSYTQANEEGPSWMNRLPRIASTARSSVSKGRDDYSAHSSTEKLPEYPPGTLPPIGLPGNFLRRQTEEETPTESPRNRRKSKWEPGKGPGGPISESAIAPQRKVKTLAQEESMSDSLNEKDISPSGSEDMEPDQMEMEDAQEKREAWEAPVKREEKLAHEPELEVYEEANDMVVEDEEGNVVAVHNVKSKTDAEKQELIRVDEKKIREDRSGTYAKGKYHPHEKTEGEEIVKKTEEVIEHPGLGWKRVSSAFGAWNGFKSLGKKSADGASIPSAQQPEQNKNQAAHAYQFGQTIILEDEYGEVIKKIDLGPKPNKRAGLRGGVQDGGAHHFDAAPLRQGLRRMSTWAGVAPKDAQPQATGQAQEGGEGSKPPKRRPEDADDDRLRFTVVGIGGRRMSKQEFIEQIQQLDPKSRRQMVEQSDAPREVKDEVHADAIHGLETDDSAFPGRGSSQPQPRKPSYSKQLFPLEESGEGMAMQGIRRMDTVQSHPNSAAPSAATSVEDIPSHNVSKSIAKRTLGEAETAAQRRRRLAAEADDSDDDGTERIPPTTTTPSASPSSCPQPQSSRSKKQSQSRSQREGDSDEEAYYGETAAERRRRLAALGEGDRDESPDSEDDNTERRPRNKTPVQQSQRRNIQFADSPAVSQGRIQWGEGEKEGKSGFPWGKKRR